jgi:SAM-dependent methyltransferase
VSHPERIVPDETSPGIVALHLKRYDFAAPYCAGKRVLDAACGVGYGTAHLGRDAAYVFGVDVDEQTIRYARERYGAANVEFAVMDVASLQLEDDSFDVVCSFETIEHVPDRESFLGEVARVLRPDGAFVVSTPNARETTETPLNPFHKVEFSRADFELLLLERFERVQIHGQRRIRTRRHRALQRLDVLGLRRRLAFVRRASAAVAGTAATESVTLDGIVIDREQLDDADEIVAVCTGLRP